MGKMTLFSCLSLLVLFDLSAVIVGDRSTATIYTTGGPVRGRILSTVVKGKEYSSFKGIPYAEPPIKRLRFKAPIPIEPWKTTLNATIEGNECPQIDMRTQNVTGDENCLFINIFSPVTNFKRRQDAPKAVMVWIHGGSFKTGSASTRFYSPDFLIEHDVVVVSFNYRLGPLGFLSMIHRNATGNAGLKDQNLVLKWVRDNVEKFGGDPNKVTIFGQSAGASCVDFHVLSDRSKGLFHRAITMSGSALADWSFHTLKEGDKLTKQLGTLLGKVSSSGNDDLLNFFYQVPAQDLIAAVEKLGMAVPFKPTIDDPRIAGEEAFISQCSLRKYATRNFSQVPYLTGFTANETLIYTSTVQSFIQIIDLAISLRESIGMHSPSNLSIVRDLVLSTNNIRDTLSEDTLNEVLGETMDLLMTYPIDENQRNLVKYSRQPVYYYRVSFDPPDSLHKQFFGVDANGTGHGDDLAYIFHIPVVNLPLDPTDPISITRDRMTRMWTNFAKFGNPTPDGENDPILNITWPVSGWFGKHLEIDDNLSIGDRPINENVRKIELIGASTAYKRNGCFDYIC